MHKKGEIEIAVGHLFAILVSVALLVLILVYMFWPFWKGIFAALG